MPPTRNELQLLEANLRTKLTMVAIYHHYYRTTDPQVADVRALYESLASNDEETVQRLSRQMRMLGNTPMSTPTNDKLEGQARVRQTVGERLRFVRTALERSVDWYQEHQAERGASPEAATLWAELLAQEQANLAAVNAVIGDS